MSNICQQCHIGRIHPIRTVYCAPFGDQVLVRPNAPAFSCDVCGYLEYDAVFLRDFRRMLNQFVAAELRTPQPTAPRSNRWQGAK